MNTTPTDTTPETTQGAGCRAGATRQEAPLGSDVANLLSACDILDAEAHPNHVEGRLGTSLIRHLLDGNTLDAYVDTDVPARYQGAPRHL